MTPRQMRNWRKARGFTQVEAADALGLTARQYQRLERDGGKITNTVSKLAACIEEKQRAADDEPHHETP